MTQPQLSIQLYTVNDHLVSDPDGTLARLAAMGIRQVEAFAFVDRADALAESFAKHGLQAKTGHAPLLSDEIRFGDRVIPVPAKADVFAAATTLGLEYVIDPFVPIDRWLDAEGIADTAARLNAVAKEAADHGLKVGYHNHAQEFIADFDGVSAYERFVALTEDRVAIELDLFWARTGGQDVPALVQRLGSRLIAVHVKDGVVPTANPWAPGAPAFGSDSLDQRHAGTGEVPLDAALRAASAVRYAVIEYDNAPGDVFTDIAASLAFLRNGGYVQ